MVTPLLQAQVDIDAPASRVWALISDFRRMPEWSPQCRWMKPLGPLRRGTRTLNLNRRNRLFWPTTCTVVEVIPEKKLAFRVNANHTIWCYELEPNGLRLGRLGRSRLRLGRFRRRLGGLRRRRRRLRRDVEHAVVEGLIRRRTGARRRRGVGMGAAAVLLVHHVPVGGQLVSADPEHHAQRPRQRQEKA